MCGKLAALPPAAIAQHFIAMAIVIHYCAA
jgi:hypothetical protein